MENRETSMGGNPHRVYPRERARPRPDERPNERRANASNPRVSSLVIGATTIAGVGIGLLAVVAGAAVIGIAAETVLIPSLLLKMAGGIAGGGVGMTKGLKDTRKLG